MNRWILAITLTLLVAGCANVRKIPGGYKTQGCLGGLVVGGVVGGAIGSKEGAIIGAIGGCIAGLFVGNYFEERQKQYASQQQAIIEETAWNRNMARKLRKTNAELAKGIQLYEEEREHINQIRMNEKQRKKFLRDQQKHFKQEFGNTLDVAKRLQTEVDNSKTQYQQYQAGANPAASKKWKTQITAFEDEAEQLNQNFNIILAKNDSL